MARLTPKPRKNVVDEKNEPPDAEEIRFLRMAHSAHKQMRNARYYYNGHWWTHPKGLPEAKKIPRVDSEEYFEGVDDPDFELDDDA